MFLSLYMKIFDENYIKLKEQIFYMVYNTHIEITYKNYEGDKSDALYRKELLEVFGLDEFDPSIITRKIEQLYEELELDNELNNKCKQNAAQMLSEDIVLGFMLCFSHDIFESTHADICRIIKTSKQKQKEVAHYS